MVKLKVFNPVAKSVETQVDPASRSPDLNGKRIGLYWNLKAGGDAALERIEERLKERYPEARFARYHGNVGFVMRHLTPTEASRIAKEVDAVVGTTSD